MTIIAQLNTLKEAYAGIEALRLRSIPPDLSKKGDNLLISVDDDFAEKARAILASDGRFTPQFIPLDSRTNLPGFEVGNA